MEKTRKLRIFSSAAVLAGVLLAGGSAQATPGALDPTFGTGGTEAVPVSSTNSSASAVEIQPDGEILAAGDSWNGVNDDFALVRLNPDGSLDSTFGSGGKVTTGFGAEDEPYALAMQPDAKIVVAGATGGDFALTRYAANGRLDLTFDSDGKVTTDLGSNFDDARALLLQADGKIIAAGRTSNGSDYDFAVVRYKPDGSLDTSFAGGGAAFTPVGSGNDYVAAAAQQPDGKFIVAGESQEGATPVTREFAFVRYTADGSLDSTFGAAGKKLIPLKEGGAAAVAVQPDGKIVAAGYSWGPSRHDQDFTLVRLKTDGSLDTSFGVGGVVTTPMGVTGDLNFDDYAQAVVLQPDGKIVAAGYARDKSDNSFFALARYNSNGSLDTSFGIGGKVTTQVESPYFSHAVALALQSDGKIVAAGNTLKGSYTNFAFARYLGSTLSVTRAGSGTGTVSSSPAGISCGSTCSAPFAAIPITLTATRDAGSVFSGWSGGGCSGTGTCQVQLSSDQQVTATFTRLRTLSVTTSGPGTVSSSPAGIDCGASCSHAFADATSVTLTATPAPGYGFTGWGGDCSGTGTCSLQMSADRAVTATFTSNPPLPKCVVPKVKGKRLAAAKRAIRRAHCSVGKITRAYSAKVKRGRVIAQKPKPGTTRPQGARVSLKVSKGRRR